MTSMITTGDGAHVNDGPGWPGQLRIEYERIDVSSSSPKVDRGWSFVDSAGHFHAAQEDKTRPWPTLRERIEVIPCDHEDHDEDCDGANIHHLHCLICDEEIKPGMIPGPHHETIPGPMSWTAKVSVPVEQANALMSDRRVSLRFESGTVEAWGVAEVGGNVSYTSGQTFIDLELRGASALGQRRRRS